MIILKLSLPLLSSRLKQNKSFLSLPDEHAVRAEEGGVCPGISERKVDHLITDSKNQVYRIEEQIPHGGTAICLQVSLDYLERPGAQKTNIARLIGHTRLVDTVKLINLF